MNKDGFVFYQNGKKISTGDVEIVPEAFLSKHVLVLGANGYSETPYYGKLADFRIYHRNLKDDEVKNISLINGPKDFSIISESSNTTSDYSYSYSYDYYSYYDNSTNSSNYNNNSHYSSDYDYSDYYEEYESDSLLSIFSQFTGESSVQFSTINVNNLLTEQSLVLFFIVEERHDYKSASSICRSFGGNVASLNFIKLIEQWVVETNISLPSVWVEPKEKKDKNKSNLNCLIGILSPLKKLKTSSSSCDSLYNILCMSDRNTPIRINGIEELEDVPFYPVDDGEGLHIDSFQNHYLYFNKKAAFLYNLGARHLYYEKPNEKISTFMGRNKWEYKDFDYEKDLGGVTLSFSICKKFQFTCSSGQCIPLEKVCDLVSNCGDRTDEKVCNVGVKVKHGYEVQYSDAHGTTGKSQVAGKLSLDQVEKVKIEDSKIDLVTTLYTKWVDKRLSFKFLAPNVTRTVLRSVFNDYWLPDIEIDGVEDSQKKVFSVLENHGDMTASTKTMGTPEVLDTYEGKIMVI